MGTSKNVNVKLAELTDMSIKQEMPREVSFDVVTDRRIRIPAITDVIPDARGIIAKTRVPLDQFTFETGKNITISGKVKLELTSGRRLRVLVGEDKVVVAEPEEAAYTLMVNLRSEADRVGDDQGPIGSSDGHTFLGKGFIALGLAVITAIGLTM